MASREDAILILKTSSVRVESVGRHILPAFNKKNFTLTSDMDSLITVLSLVLSENQCKTKVFNIVNSILINIYPQFEGFLSKYLPLAEQDFNYIPEEDLIMALAFETLGSYESTNVRALIIDSLLNPEKYIANGFNKLEIFSQLEKELEAFEESKYLLDVQRYQRHSNFTYYKLFFTYYIETLKQSGFAVDVSNRNKLYEEFQLLRQSLKNRLANGQDATKMEMATFHMFVYEGHYKLNFGVFNGAIVLHVINVEPNYILNCILNLNHFCLSWDAFYKISASEEDYIRALEINMVKHRLLNEWDEENFDLWSKGKDMLEFYSEVRDLWEEYNSTPDGQKRIRSEVLYKLRK